MDLSLRPMAESKPAATTVPPKKSAVDHAARGIGSNQRMSMRL